MASITLRGDDAAFMQDLSAQLAQDLKVLEKYIESRRVEVAIETDDGKKVKVSGSLAAIKAVLKAV